MRFYAEMDCKFYKEWRKCSDKQWYEKLDGASLMLQQAEGESHWLRTFRPMDMVVGAL